MNSSAAGGFNLFAQAASLSMLQTMQGFRQTGIPPPPPGYFLPGAGAMPQLRLHQTAAGSILNARLLGATQPPPPQPPPPPPSQPPLLADAPRPTSSSTETTAARQQEVEQHNRAQLQQQRQATPHQQQQPREAPASSPVGELVETTLEGKAIFAFDVGGEKRLCLPQVLNKVLLCAGATLADINRVCEDLNIFCDRCNSLQMTVLKERKVFGPVLESCGLITKSNAERLCKALLNGELPKYNGSVTGEDGVGVYHNCFGKQRGFLIPRLYSSPDAPCIVCNGCLALLSPQQFVGHAHSRPERETCHWGFDSNNWRLYLLLDKRLTDSAADGCLADSERACLEKLLDDVKTKFDRKRPLTTSGNCSEPAKRCRTDTNSEPVAAASSSATSAAAAASVVPKFLAPLPPTVTAGCAKVPLSQLGQGTSVLLNPESVVSLAQKSVNEHRDYAPNVRLAPSHRLAPTKIEPGSLKASGEQAASIEDVIASDWESLTDWGEGHLPEKATPQFLAMVEKVKSGYRSHIDCLKVQLARLRSQVVRTEQLESEASRLRRQLEEQGSPDVRKLRMKYTAQKEELRQLETERSRLQLALTTALRRPAESTGEAEAAAAAAVGRCSPPALELQLQQQERQQQKQES